MEAVRSTAQIQSNQGVQSSAPQSVPASSGSDFDKALQALLGGNPAQKVSEEELFSALVQERIKKIKGEEALQEFQTMLASSKESLRKPDGFVPVEDATKQALVAFRDAQKISSEEVDSIYSQSFAAAQLDGNSEALFDSRGGANDPSIAVATMEQALLASRTQIEQFDSGAAQPVKRSVTEASVGKSAAFGGGISAEGGGFLFKPSAEKDGKLVVLLPPRLTGLVKGLTLIGPDGQVIETGTYSGVGNGGREHFRFTKPGGAYPDGLTVEATLATNEIVRYFIKETSARDEQTDGSGQAAGGTTPPSAGASSPSFAVPAQGSNGSL